MDIKIKVISTETIKPSSPTPKSNQKHQLSFLDQFNHSSFSPFVYFYPSHPKIPNSEKAKQLKKSLSEVLSRYYPLAGRLVGNLYVDCNDNGVPFFDAEADCDLSQVVINPNPTHLNNFLPYKTDNDYLCIVQATHFRCGGLAVGILISHKIADGVSFISFANTWSAVARNGHCRGVPLPKFDAAAYFPQLDIPGFQPAVKGLTEEAEVAAKILTFSASEIAALQEKYAGGGGRRPSRVEALSAFIWTRFVSARGMKPDPDKIFIVQHAVNLRSRADPALSEYHFGNIIASSKVMPAAGDGDVEFLQKVRAVVKAIDGGYVARMKNSEKLLKEIMAEANKGDEVPVVRFIFSSICGYPLYEADFGWGRPIRVWCGGFSYKNTVGFLDTESGGGIEALIHLTKSDMDRFETNLEHQMLRSNL